MSKPLDIFLFKGCGSPLCQDTYEILLAKNKQLSAVISKHLSDFSTGEVNVVLSDGKTMRTMNKEFRGIDKVTDVLAFPLEEEIRGEVWLYPGAIEENSKEFKRPYEEELFRVLVHGMLHLAEYDHEKTFEEGAIEEQEEMFQMQEKIVEGIVGSEVAASKDDS